MTKLRALAWLPLAAILAACPPYPPPNPPEAQDGGVATDAEVDLDAGSPAFQACAHLGGLGCAEATPNCVEVVDHVLQTRLTPFDIACVLAATSKAQVRACPAIKCP